MEQVLMNGGQLLKFLTILEQKGATPESVQRAIASGVLADVFDPMAKFDDRDAFRSALKLGTLLPDTFRLTVDYGQSLEAMIADGHYDWKNNDITAERFPITGDGIVEFEGRYFHFNRNISSENTIKEIEAADTANPWSAAKIEHVLSHGKTFPEEQRKFPIIGLGSVAKVLGNRLVSYLGKGGSERYLDLLYRFDYVWSPGYRFLAVRKVSAVPLEL